MITNHTGANSSSNNLSWKTAKPQMYAWKVGEKNILTTSAPYIKKNNKERKVGKSEK